ncbi:MAG TPA: type II toxin-antitoxin system VapC family toxin [Sphingopyxis sp.]|nr:type II toxin-antitoxin system VapC family toxin [Sphingopyxis sp.]
MTAVLDASAILALLLAEQGSDAVLDHLANAHLGTVNMSEAIAKLAERGIPAEQTRQQIDRLELHIHDFDPDLAERTASLRPPTKPLGLSLGDRACLALALRLGLPVLTADRRMAEADKLVGLRVETIR